MKKLTTEEFINRAKSIHGDKYDYSKVAYKNNATKVCVICPNHGEFWVTPGSHLNGTGCASCAGLKRFTTEEFIERAKKVHGNRYDYSKTKYVNKRTNVIITCPIHGDFSQNPHNHINQKQGCPKCGKKFASEWRKNDYTHFLMESKERFGDIYDFPKIADEYENSHSKITIRCKQCGNEFQKIACDHLTSPHGGCLKCYANKSTGEEELGTFIVGLMGTENVLFRTRTVLPNMELDIYIPSLKIALEYNGLYWHSEDKKDKNYHLEKTEACESRGIRLIQIFEDEYLNHKDIVLSKLKHLLGKDSQTKIMARKCAVNKIDKKTAENFLNKNHIQGFANSSIYLGAFFKTELIAVMTFVKRTISRKCEKYNEWELNRFASKNGVISQGIGGKMFSFFVKEYSPKSVKSFADRRWTSSINENLYTKIGFRKEKILSPDYRYVVTKRKKIKRLHKFGFRKHILSRKFDLNPELTEAQMAKSLNLLKIYDCGLIKYVWEEKQKTAAN